MATAATAYLVVSRDDGFGDVHPLTPGVRYTIGRAPNNRVVLKDDLCSREHAELFAENGDWYLRDLGSLNGSRVNDGAISSDRRLMSHDRVQFGRSKFLFLNDLEDLPAPPTSSHPQVKSETLEIKKRLSQTRFLPVTQTARKTRSETISSEEGGTVELIPEKYSASTTETLAQLYALAVEMGTVETTDELVDLVLNGLLEHIPADVGAVLEVKQGRDLDLIRYRHRQNESETYHKVSNFVSREVLSTKEAILATDVRADQRLSGRESLTDMQVSGLICAPVLVRDQLIGLVHLYITDSDSQFTDQHLEYALAVARQFALAWHQLERRENLSVQVQSLRDQLHWDSQIIGESHSLRELQERIGRVAGTNAPVLVRGESGAGKELVARAIHDASPRREGPLVCLNCAAMTESLLESELFGHEKGAFTGATDRMAGKFESADGGTLFLDEIGEMHLSTQSKLLRVLEGHPFERVGGNVPIKVNVRVVAATNRPLEESVRDGTFRKDLFFRLQVVELWVSPLRDRKDDIPILADHFLKRFARETGRRFTNITDAAMEKLIQHEWPGNVRELRNVIERAVALGNGPVLDSSDIWLTSLDFATPDMQPYEPLPISEVEKRHIEATLRHTDWNKSQSSTILGIERSTLDRKIERYGIKK